MGRVPESPGIPATHFLLHTCAVLPNCLWSRVPEQVRDFNYACSLGHAGVWGSPVKKLFGGHPAPVNALAHSQTGVELFVWCSPFWGDRGLASEGGNDLVKGCGHGGHRKDRQLCEETAS